MMRAVCVIVVLLVFNTSTLADEPTFKELTRHKVPEAHQAVAVDESYFYAVANKSIGKYDKRSGNIMARWDSTEQMDLKHLNSGFVLEGKLYCAHSNWPTKPTKNTIEIWEVDSLTHRGRRSFPENRLAINWVDRHSGFWWVVFAEYGKKDSVSQTKLIRYDDHWKIKGSWIFPAKVVERFVPFSNSGGSFGSDGLLYATGHDRSEVYVLRVPKNRDSLELLRTLRIGIAGQGIAWDRTQRNVLYGIRRKSKEVVVSRLVE